MESRFQVGDRIKNNRNDESGIIIEVLEPNRGSQRYKIKYDNGREEDVKTQYLSPDLKITDPFKRCEANYYGYYTEYLKGNTAFKVRSSNNSTISTLKASKTLFKAYQFKPLLKFLNSDNRRLLIADEVGLGKTIEAGHILLELKARGELKNALIVCPKSLRSKWETEMNEKFGLEFIEIDKKEEFLHEMKNHNGHVKAVVNYEKLREDSDIIKYIEEKDIKFSIIICDESHNLRNESTHHYKGIRNLLESCNSAIFMSATPIMLNEKNLYNQLNLLDNEVYNNDEVFTNNLQLNRPFVRALTDLRQRKPLSEIKDKLENSIVYTSNTIGEVTTNTTCRIGEYFKDYPLYQKIISNLKSEYDTDRAKRAQLKYDISTMSPMNNIFTRTLKRDVTQDWSQAERNPHKINVSLYPAEREAYENAIDHYAESRQMWDEYENLVSGNLGIVTFKRRLASSVWATLNDTDYLDDGYDAYANEKDAKFEALLRILKTVLENGNKKLIVFAIFKNTLKYLRIRLEKEGYKCASIYGNNNIDKNVELQKFQKQEDIQVLLSSEMGSEGLDMQFCNSLVNYDLPWNPMVVEQRIGRIDRFGQTSPKVNIYNIVVNESILEDIYSRLLSRIGIFKESIGDLEAILDLDIIQDGQPVTITKALQNMESSFYSNKLTAEEISKKSEEISEAVATEKLNLKQIEEGLTNTLTNDDYFKEEINKIAGNNAYVTAYELHQLMNQLIKERLTTCEIRSTANNKIYEFVMPKSDSSVLRKFLQQYEPENPEGQLLSRRFQEDIRDENVFKITFDQEKAFEDKSITFINLYHPIIQAGVKYFEEQEDKSECTFFFALHSENLPQDIHKGLYVLAIYKVSVSRCVFGNKPMVTDSLYPVLYDIKNGRVCEDHEIAEKVMGRAQSDGEFIPFDSKYTLDSQTIINFRYDMQDYIDLYVDSHKEDLKIRIENDRRLRSEQTRQYYAERIRKIEFRISNQEAIMETTLNSDTRKNAENSIRMETGKLNKLIQKRDDELERINRDPQLKVTSEIKSLNLINIIE